MYANIHLNSKLISIGSSAILRSTIIRTLASNAFKVGYIFAAIISLSGCSDANNSPPSKENVSPEILNGTFIDSPVDGIAFQTPSQNGITDVAGTFSYIEGEAVQFSIGNIILGEGFAKPNMSPVDIVDGATTTDHPTVVNIARLLQTLDLDGDPANGIFISKNVRDSTQGLSIDFTASETSFENDQNLLTFISQTTNTSNLVPKYMAITHLEETLAGNPEFDPLTLPYTTIKQSGILSLNEVIRDQNRWSDLRTQSPISLPNIDFNTEMVITISNQHSTGGYSFNIIDIVETAAVITVNSILNIPGPGCFVTQAFSESGQTVSTVKSDKMVVFNTRQIAKDCEPEDPTIYPIFLPFTTIAAYGITSPSEVIRDGNRWDEIRTQSSTSLPDINFSNEMVISIYNLHGTGGYNNFNIINIVESANTISVNSTLNTPGPGCLVIQVLTSTGQTVRTIKSDKVIEFNTQEIPVPCN